MVYSNITELVRAQKLKAQWEDAESPRLRGLKSDLSLFSGGKNSPLKRNINAGIGKHFNASSFEEIRKKLMQTSKYMINQNLHISDLQIFHLVDKACIYFFGSQARTELHKVLQEGKLEASKRVPLHILEQELTKFQKQQTRLNRYRSQMSSMISHQSLELSSNSSSPRSKEYVNNLISPTSLGLMSQTITDKIREENQEELKQEQDASRPEIQSAMNTCEENSRLISQLNSIMQDQQFQTAESLAQIRHLIKKERLYQEKLKQIIKNREFKSQFDQALQNDEDSTLKQLQQTEFLEKEYASAEKKSQDEKQPTPKSQSSEEIPPNQNNTVLGSTFLKELQDEDENQSQEAYVQNQDQEKDEAVINYIGEPEREPEIENEGIEFPFSDVQNIQDEESKVQIRREESFEERDKQREGLASHSMMKSYSQIMDQSGYLRFQKKRVAMEEDEFSVSIDASEVAHRLEENIKEDLKRDEEGLQKDSLLSINYKESESNDYFEEEADKVNDIQLLGSESFAFDLNASLFQKKIQEMQKIKQNEKEKRQKLDNSLNYSLRGD